MTDSQWNDLKIAAKKSKNTRSYLIRIAIRAEKYTS